MPKTDWTRTLILMTLLALMVAALPARAAAMSPGTPNEESGRNTTGSRNWSSMRR